MLLSISFGICHSFTHNDSVEIPEQKHQEPQSRKTDVDISNDNFFKDGRCEERIMNGCDKEKHFSENETFDKRDLYLLY